VLEKLALLYKTAELAADEERVLKALVARPAEADDRTYFEAVVFLVNRWRGSEATRGNALRLLDQAEERLSGKADLRARVIRERGDVLFYYQRDLDRALGEYDKVVGRFADKLEDHIVRITKIRIGDVHRKKGEYERALASYEEAERFRIHTTSGDSSVRRGALLQQAETAIAHRNAELAASALDTLEWEYPAEKLAGRLSILRARAALLVKDRAEALVQLDDLVRVAPRSNEAAEALFLAAEIERSMGRTAEAMRRYERIVAEYKDSPRCGDARLRIKGTALPNGGN
jgi:tetratricopeptide (TPR) repeat protein